MPVLVIDGDTIIGLAVVYAVGKTGVDVVAMEGRDGIAKHSRYCSKAVLKPRLSELNEVTLDLVKKWGFSHVFCMSENAIATLNTNRAELEQRTRLMFPSPSIFDTALHKEKTLHLAAEAGVPIPPTVLPHDMEDARQRCRNLQFPVVVKPRSSGDPLIRLPVSFKVLRMDTYDELITFLEQFSAGGEYPLIQEYIPGRGVGVNVLFHEGEPVVIFQHVRLREVPADGGASCYCESVPADEMFVAPAVKLLKAMHWDGACMVEFRHDPRTGRFALMEVNGRFWGSIPLAIHAGVNFPALWYQITSDVSSVPKLPTAYKVSLRARSLAGDTKRFLEVLRVKKQGRAKEVAEFLVAFRPDTRYFIWRWDDPMPAIMNVVDRFRRLARR